jgi:hypothetical protein
MAEIKGTVVGAPIVPGSTDDQYPTHFEEYGAGGYRSVSNISELSTIPIPRRIAGMKVFVRSENQEYKLDVNLTTWSPLVLDGGVF